MKKLFLNFTLVLLAHIVLGLLPLHAQTITDSSLSGAWYDPVHTGEGFIVEIHEDGRAVVYWFTYDEAGAQRWFIGVGEMVGDTAVFSELLAGSGAVFGEEFDSEDVVLSNVGDLTISWASCSEAIAQYTVDGLAGSQSLDRLTHVAGMECPSPVTEASPHSGSWLDSTHVGEGIAVEMIGGGQALVYWFSYDDVGNPAWFFGVGESLEDTISIANMYITSGGRFGPEFAPDEVLVELWGSMDIELGCDYGELDYVTDSLVFGSGEQTMTRLTKLGNPVCEEPVAPNILLVIADDLGLDASTQYNIAQDLPLTPELDDLAQRGLVFDNAWSYPSCSPTRASILTGKYAFRTGVMSVGDVLSTTETSLQNYINQHLPGKYADAVIGKWHLAPNNNMDHPADLGISHFAGIISVSNDYEEWVLTIDGQQTRETEYVISKLTNLAIDWVDRQIKPWFLWLAFSAPHSPFHLPPADLHSQALSGTEEDINDNPLPYYLAAIEALDTELGRLLDSMNEQTRNNTIVIFIGDNGTPAQVVQAPYTRQKAKGSLYQGGINVPLLVSGPGVSRSGDREAALVNTTDIFATIASLAGVNVSEVNDSSSFAGLLNGEPESERAFQYSERIMDESYEWTISDGDYKLLESAAGNLELYQLISDPYEIEDLISTGNAPDDKVEELQMLVEEIWLEE